jgi:diguanylate cyclase (GGDEF)-like protein
VSERVTGPHLRPILRPSSFALWWWLVVLAAAILLTTAFGRGAFQEALTAGTPFWVLLTFVVLGELRPVVHSGRSDPHGVILATAFVFAALLYWGLELAVVAVLVATVVGEIARRKPLWALVFNVSQYTLSYAAAWIVLGLLGWEASVASPGQMTPAGLLPFLLGAVTYHLANITIVGTALGLRDPQLTVVGAILDDFGYYAWTTGAVLALSPLVVVVLDQHWGLLPLLLLPLNLLHQTAAMSVERERRSLHDDLTGLGNRALLLARLQEHVEAARPLAVCLLDLDRFKEVNDTLGHGVGDEVLRLVAERLRAGVRPEDTVARLGGDEFVLLLEVDTVEEALGIVDRVVAQLQRPYEVGGARLEVDASSGVAMLPDHGSDLEVLLRRADAAMYAAKEAASPTVVFTDDLEHATPSRLELIADLRRGIHQGELVVHYQPQVRIEDGQPIRLEALVRWDHPEQGLLPPGRFLPLIERTAVMRTLTAEVLEQVLAQLAEWGELGCSLPVAVNISLHDLADGRLTEQVVEGLHRHRIDPSRLSIEITEQALVGDPNRIHATLEALCQAGIELSLDDFGIGHASLTRLKRLPVSEVKIDRSFVQSFEGRPEDRAIVTAVVELARGLGLRCVAEGVETAQTLDALSELGCDAAQGYHLARPMPAAEAVAWMRDHGLRPAPTTPEVAADAASLGASAGSPDGAVRAGVPAVSPAVSGG